MNVAEKLRALADQVDDDPVIDLEPPPMTICEALTVLRRDVPYRYSILAVQFRMVDGVWQVEYEVWDGYTYRRNRSLHDVLASTIANAKTKRRSVTDAIADLADAGVRHAN